MKARYILEALDAMRNAEQVLLGYASRPAARPSLRSAYHAYKRLSDARTALLVYSGVRDIELEVAIAEEGTRE